MGLFSFLSRKPKLVAEYIPLVVLYAVDRDGLSAENAFALRALLLAARPRDFFYLPPGSFQVFFPGTEEGDAGAGRLAAELEAYAGCHGMLSFGVGVAAGTCIAQWDARGGFTMPPLGMTINRAARIAYQRSGQSMDV